ncbi:MAG: LacI family DNA-binding transcriptional regulator [Anaerolineae bacterium]|nr:LacI family DNA-binding transcriptional regulator [Anaerolineae bacterium]
MIKNNGRSRVTVGDVAKQAGVSTATVSRVLNKTNNVSPKTVARVQKAIDELGYVLDTAAQALSSSSNRTGNIGIIMPVINNSFLSTLLEGVNQYANTCSYNLLTFATIGQASIQDGVPLPLNENNTDGLIIFADKIDDKTLTHLYQRQFPVVLLYRLPPQGLDIPSVLIENKNGTRTLIEHLIKNCGHRRIAFMAGPAGNYDSYWREQGYCEALTACDIPIDSQLMGVGAFHDWRAKEQIEEWLEKGLDIDAIFAGDDTAAMAAIIALQQAGKRVPEDIAVVGFNNDIISKYFNPPLTTVHVPTEEIGRTAVKQLFHLINGEQTEALTPFNTELVVRQSCGCHLVNNPRWHPN